MTNCRLLLIWAGTPTRNRYADSKYTVFIAKRGQTNQKKYSDILSAFCKQVIDVQTHMSFK